jgi:2-polyprenyl-3-methyl-5-hydroxy-6-metoxy-1,4-benzoquinol methylase
MSQKEPQRGNPADVSDKVRAFYEQAPYPAPITDLDRYRDTWMNPDRRRALFHLLFPTEKYSGEQEILIAGCGTSQAAKYALREPSSHVTGIDVSESSLRYTKDLELHQLPVERVEELGNTFDHVVCTGVLHHLADPDIGLRALGSVLKPQGAMHLMVYAAYGRAGIYMMQEYSRLLEVSASPEDLRDLGATLTALPPGHPIAFLLDQAKDFSHPDALADALLHPQDRAYTVTQLHEWLQRCGMRFGRWFEQAPYLPQCGIVARTPHGTRLAALPAPSQHAAVELLRGTMTKHNFIAYRDDRSEESQPIRFDGDRWRHYVPLRLPWTVCVRERVPPGAVAVLINRAHTYTDLILPINAAQEQLYCAINGTRTIGEISRIAADDFKEKGGQEFTRAFFEQLWWYDQVVFDASH